MGPMGVTLCARAGGGPHSAPVHNLNGHMCSPPDLGMALSRRRVRNGEGGLTGRDQSNQQSDPSLRVGKQTGMRVWSSNGAWKSAVSSESVNATDIGCLARSCAA